MECVTCLSGEIRDTLAASLRLLTERFCVVLQSKECEERGLKQSSVLSASLAEAKTELISTMLLLLQCVHLRAELPSAGSAMLPHNASTVAQSLLLQVLLQVFQTSL